MAEITIKGDPVNTCGELPKAGTRAPDFVLTKPDLSDITLKDIKGKKVILNIFPSIDTPVCSMSVRKFNEEITKFPGTEVVCVSMDLPFAHSRFCETEGIKNVTSASELRNRNFGNDYGIRISEGPLAGLLARSIVILDENSKVLFSKIVTELTEEPDYEEVLGMLKPGAGSEDDHCVQTSTAEHARSGNEDDSCDDGRSG